MLTDCNKTRYATLHTCESCRRLCGAEPQCQTAPGAYCGTRHPERSTGIWNELSWIISFSHWLRKQNTPRF